MIQSLQAPFPPTQLTAKELPRVNLPALATVAVVVGGSRQALDSAFAVASAKVSAGPLAPGEPETTPFWDALIPRLAVIVREQLRTQLKKRVA